MPPMREWLAPCWLCVMTIAGNVLCTLAIAEGSRSEHSALVVRAAERVVAARVSGETEEEGDENVMLPWAKGPALPSSSSTAISEAERRSSASEDSLRTVACVSSPASAPPSNRGADADRVVFGGDDPGSNNTVAPSLSRPMASRHGADILSGRPTLAASMSVAGSSIAAAMTACGAAENSSDEEPSSNFRSLATSTDETDCAIGTLGDKVARADDASGGGLMASTRSRSTSAAAHWR
eukprot:scaffold13047_cov32-Tisochrysis_lutea.AAC.2